MKKIAVMLLCLLMTISFMACGKLGNIGGNGGSGEQGGNTPSQGENLRKPQSEYYPDDEISGQNTFSLAKKSYDGNDAVLTLKIGGSEVKIAGFKLLIKFDKKIEVNDVLPTSKFMSITENTENSGVLTLLWAGTFNITDATDICDISLSTNGATDLTFKIEIAYGGLGYIDEAAVPPVKNIRGNVTDFKLS